MMVGASMACAAFPAARNRIALIQRWASALAGRVSYRIRRPPKRSETSSLGRADVSVPIARHLPNAAPRGPCDDGTCSIPCTSNVDCFDPDQNSCLGGVCQL